MHEPLRRLNVFRYPAVLLTLGLVGWFEAIFTVEWSFPYCGNEVDGPASAVFGMPLPYIRWALVSSMEYEFMPAIFILNIIILFAIAFAFVSGIVKRFAASDRRWRRTLLNFAGLVLVLSISALTAFLVYSGVFKIPTATIAGDHESYSDFRPVRFGFHNLHYQCTPSSFWFGDKPKSKASR